MGLDPHRLPAVARAADGERADGRGRRPHPDPVRVLRARGPVAAPRDDQSRPRPLNPRLEIAGVVLTMYDARTNLSHEVADEVRHHLRDAVFETIIPRSVRLSEAPSHGLPIALYRPDSQGRRGVQRLADEFRRATAGRRRPATCDGRRGPTREPRHDRQGRSRAAPGLGRGLASLIPQRTRRRGRLVEVPLAGSRRTRTSRAADGRRGARGARREHPRARRAPAGPRHRDPRRLPARRRRATRARRAARGPRADPGARPPARGPRPARGGAGRERPARRPRPDRGGHAPTASWSTSSG